MKNIFKTIILICFTLEAHAKEKTNLPKKLECAFLIERIKGGKANRASCGHSSEKIFSTARNPQSHPRAELCKMGYISSGLDYKNFIVDFDKNLITYDTVYKTSDFFKPEMEKYYLKMGKSKAEINQILNSKPKPNTNTATIKNVLISKRDLYRDQITKERYKPTKKIRSYMISYEDVIGDIYTLSYAENIPETIITSFVGNSENSWVNIRFGNCRMIN